MTEEKLREQIGLTLEDFDENRDADMKGFIDEIMINVEKYNTAFVEKRLNDCQKNSVINFLVLALANER